MAEQPKNVLYYGDNRDVLRQHVPDESVDLVYLDPPFNSNATYNVLFGHADGSRAAGVRRGCDGSYSGVTVVYIWYGSASGVVVSGGTVSLSPSKAEVTLRDVALHSADGTRPVSYRSTEVVASSSRFAGSRNRCATRPG